VPVNYLLIEALERYHHFYGDDLLVECPTGSGRMANLQQVAREISRRLTSIFLPGTDGRRPCHGNDRRYANDPHWRDLVLFHEYFHGDNGRGVGASHQTGWTALIARLLEDAPRTASSSHAFSDELSRPSELAGEASEPAASRKTVEHRPLPALAQWS